MNSSLTMTPSAAGRPLAIPLRTLLLLAACLVPAGPAFAAERTRIRVEDYVIQAELTPKTHHLNATARVKFTALDDINSATFELHNGLRPTKVTDEKGAGVDFERFAQDSTLRVTLPQSLNKGESSVLTFTYDGALSSADDSPVEGLKLASVGEDTSVLLYAGRWFPVVGYGTNRFTASISVTVPAGMMVIGSGRVNAVQSTTSAPATPPAKGAPRTADVLKSTYTFNWQKPGFPGTIIAGYFIEQVSTMGGATVRLYLKPLHKPYANAYAEAADKELDYFASIYGPPQTLTLNIVEIPDDTVPTAWGPEISAIASRAVGEKTNYKLLANAIARQWWGASVSPATRNDSWLCDGFARYSEALYIEHAVGQGAFQDAVKDMQVGALAYDNVALTSLGKLEPFSPEAQSLSTDKGAIVLHMLRWVMGDPVFERTVRTFAMQYAGKPASAADFRQVAEQTFGGPMNWFFTQWVDSTGAPEFHNKYTVYRISKGFRVTGEISQDLDLFRMPVELKIETDGKPEVRRIDVSGTASSYSVQTYGKPRHITIDPDNWVLKNSSDLKVRIAILRGQELVQQGDLAEALREFQKALDSNHNSSLGHYRIAEVFLLQHNYQAAANSYREALNGDGEPKWTEVWSHVQLGKIFDLTGQRDRATNEYRQALQTNDNTQGALEEARKYLAQPYQPEKSAS